MAISFAIVASCTSRRESGFLKAFCIRSKRATRLFKLRIHGVDRRERPRNRKYIPTALARKQVLPDGVSLCPLRIKGVVGGQQRVDRLCQVRESLVLG